MGLTECNEEFSVKTCQESTLSLFRTVQPLHSFGRIRCLKLHFADIICITLLYCNSAKRRFLLFQDAERNLKEQLSAAQHLADRYQNELSGERLYRHYYSLNCNVEWVSVLDLIVRKVFSLLISFQEGIGGKNKHVMCRQ